MVSLILHFRNGMGEAQRAAEEVVSFYDPRYRDRLSGVDRTVTVEVEQEEDKLVIRKTWDRVAYFPYLDDEIKFFGEGERKHITGIMVESDTHFPEIFWGEPEQRQYEYHIMQHLIDGKARVDVLIEDSEKLEDITQELANIAEGFLMAVVVQNRVWQTMKILRSNDPNKIESAMKKLRDIEHITSREVNPTMHFAEERRRVDQQQGED